MMNFGMMFKNSIRIYLLLSILITPTCYLLSQILIYLGGNELGIYYCLSSIVALLIYFSPLVFARRDETLIAQLPVKAVEKWGFYMLFCLIIVPAIVEAIWFGLDFAFKFCGIGVDLTKQMFDAVKINSDIFNPIAKTILVIVSAIQTAMMIVIVLYAVISANRHRVIKGLMTLVGTLVGIGIFSGILGAFVAVAKLNENPSLAQHPENLVNSMSSILMVIYPTLFVVFIISSYLCYRKINHCEVKA